MKRSLSQEAGVIVAKKVKSIEKIEVSKQKSKNDTQKVKYAKKTSPGKKVGREIAENKSKDTKTFKLKQLGLKSKFGKKAALQDSKAVSKTKRTFTEFPDKLLGKDGKPEWNKVKEERKKLKETRKVHRTGADQYQLSVKVKSLWEKLRLKDHTAEKKEAMVNDLFMLLKGEISKVVHSHDLGRVVQWMLKLGSPAVRSSICEELCADTVAFLQSKYASYCVKRALKYGSKADCRHLIRSCYGSFLKLLSHTFAWPVVEMMFSTFAYADERRQMHRELYGEMHALLPPEVRRIAAVPEDMRPSIQQAAKVNLTKLLAKKDLLKSTLVQAVLNDFLSSCSEQDCNEILELIQEDILDLLSTKEGSRVALMAVWHATNKMKKVIVKALKGRVKEFATSENGYMILLALFDSIDDTVLVKKALIPELLSEAEELAKNELGRKVILYLVAHRDPAYFHPQQINIFAKGDTISKRKKDATVREQEMLEAVSEPLLGAIAADLPTWLGQASTTMVSLAIMKSGKGEALQALFEKIVSFALDPASSVSRSTEINKRMFHVVEDSAMHLVFKKLIQLDQTNPDRTAETFSMVLASRLTEDSLSYILQFNRGCFLMVLLYESKDKKVCKILNSKMTESNKKFLQKQETTGAKILLKKLAEQTIN